MSNPFDAAKQWLALGAQGAVMFGNDDHAESCRSAIRDAGACGQINLFEEGA
jgi:hypothetical protein